MNIYQKLGTARVKLQQKNLKKSGENKFSNFKYYELADFLPSINEIFAELGLLSVFNLDNEKASLKVINAEKTDEIIEFETPVTEVDLKGCTKIQAIGACSTYARRYLYLNALEITEADVLDKNAGNDKLIENKTTSKPIENDKPTCPICGKPTTAMALKSWSCCPTCKSKQAKEKAATL